MASAANSRNAHFRERGSPYLSQTTHILDDRTSDLVIGGADALHVVAQRAFFIEHYGDFNSAAKISQRNQTYRL
jgi:hypothetical protein